ncbi:MAG: DNA alkylation repair protein [Myxococcaceae bacterium]
MADRLKDFFDEDVVRRIGGMIRGVWPSFPEHEFVEKASDGLERLELLERGRHIMRALRETLPDDPERAMDILVRSAGEELKGVDGNGMAPFLYLPHVMFVAEYGLDHFDASMQAQHALTKRFTCEFSIRAFLERAPERTIEVLRGWADDPSPHVRRLVSEGTRPRLPWARRLPAFQKNPAPVLELLELLKGDAEEFVRRSVANNLNDIGKDHPDLLVETCARWLEHASPDKKRLVRHALRSLVKKCHPGALALMGAGSSKGVRVRGTVQPARVCIGGKVEVAVEVENRSREDRNMVVDLAVHFVKANGAARPKVFKLRNVALAPGEAAALRKTITLRQLTTRAHHPGEHRVEILLNGRADPIGVFLLTVG